MKILIVNRNYFITGGPENYMFSLMEHMPEHQFIPFCIDFEKSRETPYRKYFVPPPADPHDIYYKDFNLSPGRKIAFAFDSIYHFGSRRRLERLIKDERPDLAYFLNAVSLSDSVIDACRSQKVPIIWRMSDFHKVCASYLLYRDGHVCEDCLDHGLIRAIVNKCGGHQRSFEAATVKVAGMWLSRMRKSYDHVDYLVTPSEFTREKLIKGGFEPAKIVHIPTWVDATQGVAGKITPSREILFVGRLSPEKGVDILLKAFMLRNDKESRLSIVGNDTSEYAQKLKATIHGAFAERIRFLGFQSREAITDLLRSAACLVVPSVWYENQPNVVLEGMACDCPVIVSDAGSLKEMVVHGKTGYRFKAGNAQDLADKLGDLLMNTAKAREVAMAGRKYVSEHHSKQRHLASLNALFEKCLTPKAGVLRCS